MTENVLTYLELWVKMLKLDQDSQAYDDICDDMDGVWYSMTQDEINEVERILDLR